jgi:hypothetical protein
VEKVGEGWPPIFRDDVRISGRRGGGFSPFLFDGMDKHYYFGNLIYSIFAHLDSGFQYKDPSLAKRFLPAYSLTRSRIFSFRK